MRIECVGGMLIEVTWCGDTVSIQAHEAGVVEGTISIPAEHVYDVIGALRACAREHIDNNGEPPAQV